MAFNLILLEVPSFNRFLECGIERCACPNDVVRKAGMTLGWSGEVHRGRPPFSSIPTYTQCFAAVATDAIDSRVADAGKSAHPFLGFPQHGLRDHVPLGYL